MNLLLDSHTFLWWADDPDRLSKNATAALTLSENKLFLSVASIWEIEIKVYAGKLKLREALSDMVNREVTKNQFNLLPVTENHVYALKSLPPIHKDPFDRILIAQALTMSATLISADKIVSQYPVTVLW